MVLFTIGSVLVRVFDEPLLKETDSNICYIDANGSANQLNALGLIKGDELHWFKL